MATISKFDLNVIESIAKLLGDTSNGFTGSEITSLLNASKIEDIAPGSTKWKRLNSALVNKQDLDKCANNILAFIEHAMKPSRHINNHEWFNNTRFELNKVLSFAGYSLQENGKISTTPKSYTISEAAAKASMLKEHLLIRKVHPDILLYCREELLVDNYFHVVFEATKSVADKIRMKTDLNSDGAALVDDAFSFKDKVPHLALNTLQTESEQSGATGMVVS